MAIQAPPSSATDEERADDDDALADKIEAAIQPHLDRWVTLRRRPDGLEEASDHRPTSRWVPFVAEGDPVYTGAPTTGIACAQDNPLRLWALMSGPRHDVVQTIYREAELAQEWEGIADAPGGPLGIVPPCLQPKMAIPPAREASSQGTVSVARSKLIAGGACMFIAAGAIYAGAPNIRAGNQLYVNALTTARQFLELAGIDVSDIDVHNLSNE